MKKDFQKELFAFLGQRRKIIIDSQNGITYNGFNLKENGYSLKLTGLHLSFVKELKEVTQGHIFYELLDTFVGTRDLLKDVVFPELLSNDVKLKNFEFKGNFTDEVKVLLVKSNHEVLKKVFDRELNLLGLIIRNIHNAYCDIRFKFENETGVLNNEPHQKLTFIGNQNTLIYFLWSLYKSKKFKFPERNERQDFEKYVAKYFNYSKNYLDIPSDIIFPANVISKFLEKLPHRKHFITKPPQKTKDLLFILEEMKSEISGMIENVKNTDLREEEFEQ